MRTDLTTGLKYRVSQKEITRRHQLLRRFMQERDLGLLLIIEPYAEGYRRWVTGVEGTERHTETCLLVPLEGNIYQIIGNKMLSADEEVSQPIGAQPDPEEAFEGVQTIYYFSAFMIRKLLKKSEKATLGVIHGNRIRAEMKDYLDEKLPDVRWVEVTRELRIERAVKSSEEIGLLQNAVHLQEQVLDGLKGYLKPGMLEIEAVHYARYLADHLESGGIDHMLSAQVELISWAEKQESLPLLYPGRRLIADDSIYVTLRLLGDSGYYGTISRCMSFGSPGDGVKSAYEDVVAALQLAEKLLYVGISIEQVKKKIYQELPQMAWDGNRNMIHGIGYCITEAPDETHSPDMILQENMTIAVEPKVRDKEGNILGISNVYSVTGEGVCCLNKAGKDWIIL